MNQLSFSLIITLVITTVTAEKTKEKSAEALGNGKGHKEGQETWGYVAVRPNANMFWWLYYSQANLSDYTQSPLILWIQGGPGSSGTGFGNFAEIGPLTVEQTTRNTSWVQFANVLFVDNPVGTGYSYVNNISDLCTNQTQITSDLLTFMKAFLKKLPEFQTVPFYIFSESYGGKMAADLALGLYKGIEKGKIKLNFKAVALGDGWISPIDSTLNYGNYLYSTSLLDSNGLNIVNQAALNAKTAVDSGNFAEATNQWRGVQAAVEKLTDGVDWYNILYTPDEDKIKNKVKITSEILEKQPKMEKLFEVFVNGFNNNELQKLMNGTVKDKLRIIPKNVTWGGQGPAVFAALTPDFMRPVTNTVEALLNKTNIDVIIYTGQLDLIVNTLGTLAWMDKLNWPGAESFRTANRKPVELPNQGNWGFIKSFKNLHMFWILRAGHMVPSDSPQEAMKMVQMVIAMSKPGTNSPQ